jgi:hypothetical protein
MSDIWTLEWPRGRLALHGAGGMLADLRLLLDDGREVEPLYHAPWLDEPETQAEGMLANLRGEFACLPWGAPSALPGGSRLPDRLQPEDLQLHGYPAMAAWRLVDSSPTHLSIGLDFPGHNALRRLVRTIHVDPMRASVDLKLTIEARNACRRTIAFHPSFALPDTPGTVEIVPDGFAFGIVQPQGTETALSKALPGAQFERLGSVPLAGGGDGAFDRLPFAEAREEILMLCGVTGGVSLNDLAAGVTYRMTWNNDRLPNLALWMSNRGRVHSPWNGRNLCVGVEPCVSAFGGILASLADNPVKKRGVATSLELHPGGTMQLSYQISASLKEGAALK